MHGSVGAVGRRGGVAEIVGEALGKGLDGGLGSVVGGVSGRVRDALFGAGEDDCVWRRVLL